MPQSIQAAISNPNLIIKEKCKRSLATFIKYAWQVLEPAQPYMHGWHLDAMAEHLQAITQGKLTRLLFKLVKTMDHNNTTTAFELPGKKIAGISRSLPNSAKRRVRRPTS